MKISSLLMLAAACVSAPAAPGKTEAAPKGPPTADEVTAFLDKTNTDLRTYGIKSNTASWIQNTYITDDTDRAAADASAASLAVSTEAVKQAAKYKDVPGLDADHARMLDNLRTRGAGPSDPAHRIELTTLSTKLSSMYGKGKWCKNANDCKDLEELTQLMAKSRSYDELLDAWTGWRKVSKPMRPLYARRVELLNEGAREAGYANVGDLWRSGYDMTPAQFEQETDRLWQQVKPLYGDLHCYVRAQLQKTYGKDKVPDGAPIPAHLLGNMWAQEWNNIYPLVEPYKQTTSLDVDGALKGQNWDWKRMVKTGEGFYVSLGLDPLPATFWERSMFLKPKDRDVVCHASAWDVMNDNDLRIKMCIKITGEDLQTIHHELGHNYYQHYHYKLPYLLQGGANDGFHEAIGDSIVLSMTPGYLKQLGLIQNIPNDEHGLIDVQLKDALTRVSFLPFGLLIDKWRWAVFSGAIKPADYNRTWWELRTKYQGVAAPVSRSEDDFDPGAKFHVAANVPYMRYFLARILQFQFHRAMCQAAGFRGPLHECSVYGNKAAGDRLRAMLALGRSKPWPDALQAMTGQRDMDGSALLEYFAPLQKWLKEQNQGQKCGW
ncbi:MAG: M2 family metallopeptidase [Deltaproteobacteria bacterium]|nr:MAG: M2 family metallopeptidase [Deltaproteobacteria bacterium]